MFYETSPPSLQWKTLKRPLRDGSQVLVMACDICSSSDIIEDLTTGSRVGKYRELLSFLKHALADVQNRFVFFEVYKFTGDGWILLFPKESAAGNGAKVLQMMRELSEAFRKEFNSEIRSHLDSPPKVMGLNFGLDSGPIYHSTILGVDEYFGRPIVVACRLQGEIKNIDKSPGYKALVSNAAFQEYFAPAAGFQKSAHRRILHNVNRGKPFHCKKLALLSKRASA